MTTVLAVPQTGRDVSATGAGAQFGSVAVETITIADIVIISFASPAFNYHYFLLDYYFMLDTFINVEVCMDLGLMAGLFYILSANHAEMYGASVSRGAVTCFAAFGGIGLFLRRLMAAVAPSIAAQCREILARFLRVEGLS